MIKSVISGFPYQYTPSSQQLEILQKIDDAFTSKKRFIICCAPTGSGKSFLARTLGNLGNAPTEDFKQLIQSYDAYKVDFEGNYTYEHECKSEPAHGAFALTITKSLQDQYQDLFTEAETLKGKTNYTCDVDKNYDVELAPCTFAPTLREQCWEQNRCPYYNARNETLLSQFAVLNYKMFLSLPGHLKRKNYLICDEASELEDEIIRQFSAEINYEKISQHGITVSPLITDNQERAFGWLQGLIEPLTEEINIFLSKSNKNLLTQTEKNRYHFLKNLHRSITVITTHWNECEFIIDNDAKRVIFTPLHANTLSKYIFDYGDKILLMSATIIDHKHFAKSLGITDYEYIEVDSTFEASKSPIYTSSKYKLNYKNLHQSLPGVCELIEQIVKHHKNEKGIIHTHSNEITGVVKERLEHTGRLLCRDTNNTNEDILKIHNSTDEPTVLVSPSLVYGVDLKDNLARFQIIIKLPFLPLSSKRIKKLFEQDSVWYENKMLNAVVQAAGRATRNKDDYSITYILDGNFLNTIKRARNKLPKYFVDRIQ